MSDLHILGEIGMLPYLMPGGLQMLMEIKAIEPDDFERMKVLIWRGLGDIIKEKCKLDDKIAVKGKLVKRDGETVLLAETVSLITVMEKENVAE